MSSYIESSDIYARYGTVNVRRWANLDCVVDSGGTSSGTVTIDARIETAITWASNRVDDRLRRSDLNFNLPLTTVPTTIVDIVVKLAGYWLSTARGVTNYDRDGSPITRLWGDYRDALGTLDAIVQGELKLDI